MQRTLTHWRSRIPRILKDYAARNGIRRSFGVFSTVYSAAVPDALTEQDWRAVPNLNELGGGFAMSVVPKRVGALTLDLLERNLAPGSAWTRSGLPPGR